MTMPPPFSLVAAALSVSDPALPRRRPVSPPALRSALVLALAYVPLLILPALSPLGVTLLAAALGTAGLFNFARMVGLTGHPRFFVPTLLSALCFFLAARVH